jgi:hypothetical protein
LALALGLLECGIWIMSPLDVHVVPPFFCHLGGCRRWAVAVYSG